jgi:hypothetical protein
MNLFYQISVVLNGCVCVYLIVYFLWVLSALTYFYRLAFTVDVTNWSKTDSNKNLIDAVQVLQSKLSILEYNVSALSSELSEEKSMRCALQTILKNYLASSYKDYDNIEWPAMENKI